MQKLNPRKGKKGQLLVQISGTMERPIWCRPPVYFWDKMMAKHAGLVETAQYQPQPRAATNDTGARAAA